MSIFIIPIFIRSAERKNSFIAERVDGIVAVYCGERITKKRMMYPVLLLDRRDIIGSVLYDGPVKKVCFNKDGNLCVKLENGHVEYVTLGNSNAKKGM